MQRCNNTPWTFPPFDILHSVAGPGLVDYRSGIEGRVEPMIRGSRVLRRASQGPQG